MTIQADHTMGRQQQHQRPPPRNRGRSNNSRTPPPPTSPHRSPARRKSKAMGAISGTPDLPYGAASPSRQLIAAGAPNPQWQISQHNNSNNSMPHYDRKHPPPPPPPRSPNPGSKTSLHTPTSTGTNQIAAAAQELQRAYSAGSGYPAAAARGRNSERRKSHSNSLGHQAERRSRSGGDIIASHSDDRAMVAAAFHQQRYGNSGSSYSSTNSPVLEWEQQRRRSRGKGDIMAVHNDGKEGYSNYSLNNSNSNPRGNSGHYDCEQYGAPVLPLNSSEEEEDESVYEDTPREENCLVRLLGVMLCIFPRYEHLPWGTFIVLTMWTAIPPGCFILFFTQMGFGEQIYYTIAIEIGHYSTAVGLVLSFYILLLYMLDADEWTSRAGSIFLDFSTLFIVCGFVLLVLLIADRFPYGMVCLFAIFHPLWLLALKLVFYSEKGTRVFVSWMSGPLFFVSVATIVAWTVWVFSDPDNEWNIVARVVAAERTGCEPNYEENPECRAEAGSDTTCFYVEKVNGMENLVFPDGCEQSCTDVYNDCLNGFILWVGPVLVSMTTFFLSFFCTFLRTDGAKEKDVLNFGAIWIFILFAMWVTTSLAGSAAGVTAALAALTLASFIASAMFIAVSFSKEERLENAGAVFDRLREKYGNQLNVTRGLFVVTCAPIVLVYFGFSITNQFVRKTRIFPCSQPPGEEVSILTTRTRKQADMMKSWDRAQVYTYATYWGIAFMILQVLVANLTVVFLSWMIEKTANISLGAVTAIMAGVGVLMFLLPPVPGVPVYLTLGIVLPAQGHEVFGWTGAIMYSVGIGLLLKLFSSALQQKMIGQNLSHYVKVRQFVGINSTLMKAMRVVLEKPGLSVPKVSILIGGPDWPTSVLCGIMRLNLPQIMLGTMPIVFLIMPTCLTGALLYMASLETASGNPEFPWAATVSTITASATAIVQFGSMIVAAYYLEQTASNRPADVAGIPDDSEVKEADDKATHLRRCYTDVTQWDIIPGSAKSLLQISLVSIIASSYMVQLFPSLCFTPHNLTDSIGENLGGKVTNLFLPLGWLSIVLFGISIIFLYLFKSWGESKAHKLANGISVSPGESIANSSTSEPFDHGHRAL